MLAIYCNPSSTMRPLSPSPLLPCNIIHVWHGCGLLLSRLSLVRVLSARSSSRPPPPNTAAVVNQNQQQSDEREGEAEARWSEASASHRGSIIPPLPSPPPPPPPPLNRRRDSQTSTAVGRGQGRDRRHSSVLLEFPTHKQEEGEERSVSPSGDPFDAFSRLRQRQSQSQRESQSQSRATAPSSESNLLGSGSAAKGADRARKTLQEERIKQRANKLERAKSFRRNSKPPNPHSNRVQHRAKVAFRTAAQVS